MDFRKCFILAALCVALSSLTAAEPAAPAAAKPAEPAAAPEYQPPALENPDSWTMVVVPDVQAYIKRRCNHGILDIMNAWMDLRDYLRRCRPPACELVQRQDQFQRRPLR